MKSYHPMEWTTSQPICAVPTTTPTPPLSRIMYVSIVFTNEGPYWEAKNSPDNQETLTLTWLPKGSLQCSQNFLSETNSVYSLSSYFLRIHFNIILLSRDRSSKWYRSLRLPHRSPVRISILRHTRYILCLSHLPSSDDPVSDKKYKSWTSSLYIFLLSRSFNSYGGKRAEKYFYLPWRNSPPPSGPLSPHYRGSWSHSNTHTHTHTTVGRTPLDEWSARRRDLYLTTHNTHKILTSMQPAGFEPATPSSGRPQTHALDRAATGERYVLTYYFQASINQMPLSKRSRDAVSFS